MTVTQESVFRDLQALRKGWGILHQRAGGPGPSLMSLIGESSEAPLDALMELISAAAQKLPAEKRLHALVAMGMQEDVNRSTLDQRRAWLVEHENYSDRTATRRMDEALRDLARQLTGDFRAQAEWHFRRFEAVLQLNTSQPEAMEYRTVVIDRGVVNELETSISVPRHPDDSSSEHRVDFDLVFGGKLTSRDTGYETIFEQSIALSKPLSSGEEHRYAMRVRVPAGQPLAPHYVYVPLRACESFDLRILFDMRDVPAVVWRITGAPTAAIYERTPTSDIVQPDAFGEVHASFDQIVVGRSYGLCWGSP